MNKSILLVVTTTVLLLSSCCSKGNQEKSPLLGNTPNVVQELIEKRIKLNIELDKARASHQKDDALYLRTRDQELREEYYGKFAAATKEIIGNKLKAENYTLSYEITSQPTISKSVYDSAENRLAYALQFDYTIKATEDLTPDYFDKEEGWMYKVNYMIVDKKGLCLGVSSESKKFNLGDAAMNKDVVPTIPTGSELATSFELSFATRGAEDLLQYSKEDFKPYKIVFITKSELDCAIHMMQFRYDKEPDNVTKDATDKPKYFDVPYVVSTYPENGAVVDSTLTHVRIKFSQAMNIGTKGLGAVDDKSVIYIFADKERTSEERKSLVYWEDPYTYVLKVDVKLESGKKYGVRVLSTYFQSEDLQLPCESNCEVVFTVK